MSVIRELYKVDDFPALGKFTNLIERIDTAPPEKHKDEVVKHLEKHLGCVILQSTSSEEDILRAQLLVMEARQVDPSDRDIMLQLELQSISLENQL